MKIKEFAQLLEKIETTPGRNDMTVMLAECLQKFDQSEVKAAMYLMQGRLVPNYVPVEFNFSQKLALRSLSDFLAAGDEKKVNELFAKLGDVGLVAETLRKEKSEDDKNLNIVEVYGQLTTIAEATGKGSQEAKMSGFAKLILQLDPLSARYVSRVVIGSLRLGLSDKTLFDALSWAKTGSKKIRDDIERAYGARADIGELVSMIMTTDELDLIDKLETVKLKPGIPLASKLVEREKDATAVFERLDSCILQPKLDGLRTQIHLTKDGEVAIFSRNMESLTDSFPDIVAATRQLGVESAIIDSEAIGYDFENETYLPFQETMQRRRKYDIGEMAESIPVKAMAFDLMYLNGEDLTQQPVEDRLKKLQEVLSKSKQEVITQLETFEAKDAESLETYFQEQIGKGLEGIIAKKLGTPYEPGTRNFDWIKYKANTQASMVDTVDSVVLGYYTGRGVRAKFGIGAVLVGVYNKDDGKFYSVAKVGTGMKDEDWETIMRDLKPLELPAQPAESVVQKLLHPDVWVQPKIVMEVDADQITRSPSHTTAWDKPASFETETKGKGLSLRFPRMKVWKRDKDAEQATSVSELLRMFELRRPS
jgi:DNA ligase 1